MNNENIERQNYIMWFRTWGCWNSVSIYKWIIWYLDEGLVIEHINKFNTIKIGDKFNIQVEMTRGVIKNE